MKTKFQLHPSFNFINNYYLFISRKVRIQNILVLLAMVPFIILSQGTVELASFYSNSLEENRSIYIYLPEGYNPGGTIDYPVVYFLHGGGFGSYQYIHDILDDLIGSGAISPIILVQPDGTGGPYYGGFYTNSELNGNFEDYGTYDVVEFIDANYKTIPTPQNRSIMGHSWGAFSCMKLALKHPNVFGAVAAHSGTPDLTTGVDVWRPHVLMENGGSAPFNFDPDAGVFSISMFGWAGAFSPNLNIPPYLVDFPLDSNGNIVDSIMMKWQQHNPAILASQLSPSTAPTIFFDCGTIDEYECYPMNTAFADSLDQLEIPYTFQSYYGSHFNQLPDRFAISLTFLDSIMILTSVESSMLNSKPKDFFLYQNAPNPFCTMTTINYNLPVNTIVNLTIYNTLGKEVRKLISEFQMSGKKSIIWDGNDNMGKAAKPGNYIYSIRAGNNYIWKETKKMLLLK